MATTEAPTRPLLPIASGKRTLATVRALLRPNRGLAVIAMITLVGATAVSLLTAPILGRIVDLVVAGETPDSLVVPVGLLAGVALVAGVGTAIGVALVGRLGENMVAALRERFVERALRLPLERVEQAGSGDLTSRVTSDVTMVTKVVRDALPHFLRSALMIVLTLGGLAILDWRFLLAALLSMPIQLHTVRWYVGRAIPLYAAHREAVGTVHHRLLDTAGGAPTVRAFHLADSHTGKIRQASETALELALRGIRLLTGFFARLNLAEYVGLTAVLATGFWLVNADAVTIGTTTAAALYFHNLFNPINTALMLVDDAQSAGASLARLVGVTDLAPEPEPGKEHVASDAAVKATALRYAFVPGHDVLRDIDLDLQPGERVALIGASGAGKTTLAKLLAGVHTPTGGSITVGGLRLDELGPAAARRAVALISQEVHVFAGPLADDLRLAKQDATDEELRGALATVGALDWACALSDGLATVVGTGGHKLTATQAQQLALARLVLADPPIAILDEATADAGSAGSRELEASADAALSGRTALVVAHRLTQAVNADRVIVLDNGRIIESGSHTQLLDAGGHYAELWRAWSAGRGG
ncbi:MAG: ATP-binding cassette domain-containing protein [Actinophytocola sp.]|nr:ATP-binding cassette domain-containing protein [Actinophytocola sp.]